MKFLGMRVQDKNRKTHPFSAEKFFAPGKQQVVKKMFDETFFLCGKKFSSCRASNVTLTISQIAVRFQTSRKLPHQTSPGNGKI